jgi:solute carrier family 35 protein
MSSMSSKAQHHTGKPDSDSHAKSSSLLAKGGSALFYAASSTAVILVNKTVLSAYHFPAFFFLALCQFITTSMVLMFLAAFRKVDLPRLDAALFRDIVPISIFYFGNVLSGLGGTASLNLPMFTVLRRFSIAMTMGCEYYVLRKKPSREVFLSVCAMVFGAMVAAANDLSFDLMGYAMVLTNDVFTALSGVYMKKATSSMSPATSNKLGVLFYNSLFSGIALLFYLCILSMHQQSTGQLTVIEDIMSFDGWSDPHFMFLFVLAAFMGSVLNYSIVLCTANNSALTTAVIGCLKNVLVTYYGIIVMAGYIFNMLNFIGLNISIAGSLYYTYVIMFRRK